MAFLELQPTTWFGGPDGLLENLLDFLLGTEVTGESLGAPNGVLTNFSGTAANSPIPKSRIVITYTVGATVYTATDDAAGFIIGAHINPTTSTLVYATGAYVLNFTTAPDNATALTADYIYGNPGEDWRLIRSTYAHKDTAGLTRTPYSISDTVSSYLLGTGTGAQTVFSVAQVPNVPYPDAVFVTWCPYLEFTIGAVTYTAGCHEVADQLHWNSAATDNTLIGSNTRGQVDGQFYHAQITSSSISWDSDRAVTVTFSNPPDNATSITLKYWSVPYEKAACHEYIIGNVGNNGVEPIYLGLMQDYAVPSTGYVYITAWNQWNSDPANTLGLRSGKDVTQPNNLAWSSSWLENLSLCIYSNNGRVICFFETQTGFHQSFYHGHFLRACSPEYYKNPIFIGGNCGSVFYAHTSVQDGHSIFARLDIVSTARHYVCRPDNSFIESSSSSNTLSSDVDIPITTAKIGPMTNGGVLCHPVYLWSPMNGTAKEFLGAFDGFFWTPNENLSSLDLIDDGVDTYRVFSEIGATDWWDFYAVKRE